MGTRCVTLLLIEVSNNALVLSQKIKSKLYIKDQFIKSVDTFLIIIIVELKIIIQVTRFIYVPHFKNKNKFKKKRSSYTCIQSVCFMQEHMYCFSFICGKSMGIFNMGNEQQYKKSYVYIRYQIK